MPSYKYRIDLVRVRLPEMLSSGCLLVFEPLLALLVLDTGFEDSAGARSRSAVAVESSSDPTSRSDETEHYFWPAHGPKTDEGIVLNTPPTSFSFIKALVLWKGLFCTSKVEY